MADDERDSNAEEEEPSEVSLDSRFVKAKDEATFLKLFANRMKVVVVAFLIPGYAHCEAILQRLKEYAEDAAIEHAVILVADPNALPRIAKRNGLVAVPTLQFCWRRKIIYHFSGTNQEKLHYYLTRCLEMRADFASSTTLWGRYFTPQARLVRGGAVRLARLQPDLRNAFVGVGWEPPDKPADPLAETPPPLQLDAAVVAVGADRLAATPEDIISGRNPRHRSGAVVHHGGTMRGDGSGDDVTIELALHQVPAAVAELLFYLVVHGPPGQSLAQVKEPYIRVYDKERTGEKEEGGVDEVPPLVAYDADDDAGEEGAYAAATVLLLGRLRRAPDGWEFEATGEPRRGSYEDLCRSLTAGA